MQALPLTSMTKTNSYPQLKAQELRFLQIAQRAAIVLAILLVCSSQAVLAQQTKPIEPIEPCTDAPATGKATLKQTVATPTTQPNVTVKKTEPVQTLVDESIPSDPEVEKLIEPYAAKVRALEVVVGKLDSELKKERVGAGSLGSFVTTGLRAQAIQRLGRPVDVMITNAGGLRKNTIAPGELRASDIFELLPFENALIRLDFPGEQLLKLLAVVLKGRDAQAGARIKYRLNPENNLEFVSATLVDAKGRDVEIDPKKIYSLVTIDYLLSLKSGDFTILQEGQNAMPLGLTMRDALMEYVKAETAAGRSIKAAPDGRFVLLEGAEKAKPEAQP